MVTWRTIIIISRLQTKWMCRRPQSFSIIPLAVLRSCSQLVNSWWYFAVDELGDVVGVKHLRLSPASIPVTRFRRVESILVDQLALGLSSNVANESKLSALNFQDYWLLDSDHFMYLYVGYLVDTFDVEHDSITAGGEAVQAVFELFGDDLALTVTEQYREA